MTFELMINDNLKSLTFSLATGLLMAVSTLTYAQREVPHLWSQLEDEAGVLSGSTAQAVENSLKSFADSTTNQVAVLIISSLDGEVLEDFSLRVAEQNKLGQKDRDNGVLLLIAIEDRKMRIEVGYGLEGVLTDAICSEIIRNEIAPHFRRQDYDQGVTDGVNAIFHAIGGEYSAEDYTSIDMDDSPLPISGEEKWMIGIFVFSILGIFTFFAILSKGGAGWFLYFFLIPFYAAFPSVIFGWNIGSKILIGYLLVVGILKILANSMGWSKKMSGGSRGGGGWSSGSGWSSSSSGGGFSGGGGSFGGGGSSGGW